MSFRAAACCIGMTLVANSLPIAQQIIRLFALRFPACGRSLRQNVLTQFGGADEKWEKEEIFETLF